MCEPYFSVNQFEDHGGGLGTGGRLGLLIGGGLDKIATRIRKWFHLAKAGAGHSESMAKCNIRETFEFNSTKYETAWWNRTTKIDGKYVGEFQPSDALIACEKYADIAAIGDIQVFRRWFEATLNATDRGMQYIDRFRLMLNQKGKDEFDRKSVYCGLRRAGSIWYHKTLSKEAVSMFLGLTRKRNLLCPEWADNQELWQSSLSQRRILKLS